MITLTNEEKKTMQSDLLSKVLDNINNYSCYEDLSDEDVLRMSIIEKINPKDYSLLKMEVLEFITKTD